MLAFIRAFLEGREAQVSAAGVCSTVRRMTRGVPQGSVLSPLLFSVALAALPQAARIGERTIRPVHMAVYADDIAIWAADRGCCGKSFQKELQRALDNTYHFLTTLGLTLSAAKSVALLNAPHRTYKFTLSLQIAGASVPIVKQATYLGLELDDRVLWQPAVSTDLNNNKKTTSILHILGGGLLNTWHDEFSVRLVNFGEWLDVKLGASSAKPVVSENQWKGVVFKHGGFDNSRDVVDGDAKTSRSDGRDRTTPDDDEGSCCPREEL
ncbi:hypothetical protein ISCGN_023289 [Ixodes scapularis]